MSEYQKSIKDLTTEGYMIPEKSEVIGYQEPISSVLTQSGDRIMVSQNNVIIRLLEKINEKLDKLIKDKTISNDNNPPTKSLKEKELDDIIVSLNNLKIEGKKPPKRNHNLWYLKEKNPPDVTPEIREKYFNFK